MVGQVIGAQSCTRIKEHAEGSVRGSTQIQVDVRKVFVDAKRHGAESWAGIDLVLAGSNEEGIVSRSLGRRGCGFVAVVGSGRTVGSNVELLCHPCRLVAVRATASTRGGRSAVEGRRASTRRARDMAIGRVASL